MTGVLNYVLISCGGWTSVDTNTGKREHRMGGAPGRPLGVARERTETTCTGWEDVHKPQEGGTSSCLALQRTPSLYTEGTQ